jgi:hypothetical protein
MRSGEHTDLDQKEQCERDPGRIQLFRPSEHEPKIIDKLQEMAKRKGTKMTSVALA